jgi:hypothetical protein
MKKLTKVQQGDVILNRIEEIPEGATKVPLTSRWYTVAYGEATGHSHVIKDTQNIELYELNGTLFVRALADADLQHVEESGTKAEHDTVPIQEGTWQIRTPREWDAFDEEARNIRD